VSYEFYHDELRFEMSTAPITTLEEEDGTRSSTLIATLVLVAIADSMITEGIIEGTERNR